MPLRTGFANAKGDICLVQDADLEYDPSDYPKLIKPILKTRPMSFMAVDFLEVGRIELFILAQIGNGF